MLQEAVYLSNQPQHLITTAHSATAHVSIWLNGRPLCTIQMFLLVAFFHHNRFNMG